MDLTPILNLDSRTKSAFVDATAHEVVEGAIVRLGNSDVVDVVDGGGGGEGVEGANRR